MKTSNAEAHEAWDKVPLMEEILHQLILVGYPWLSHYLQGFIHPRWCRISSINSNYVMTHDCWQIAYWKSGFSKTCAADCRRNLVTRQQKGRSRLVRQSNLPDRCQQQRFENWSITFDNLQCACNCITYLHILREYRTWDTYTSGHHLPTKTPISGAQVVRYLCEAGADKAKSSELKHAKNPSGLRLKLEWLKYVKFEDLSIEPRNPKFVFEPVRIPIRRFTLHVFYMTLALGMVAITIQFLCAGFR